MKDTISMLAAMIMAGGLSVAAVSQAAAAQMSANVGWTATHAVTLSTACKDPHCKPGSGKCHDPSCPGCSHCH
ncbi:MAG: hypothetical protein M0Z50_11565 [Planctomycetia bacterium]|nr:hypothetical protein [Planctomycetia bacterium]